MYSDGRKGILYDIFMIHIPITYNIILIHKFIIMNYLFLIDLNKNFKNNIY